MEKQNDSLKQLLHITDAMLKGDYSKRMSFESDDQLLNRIAENLNQLQDTLMLNGDHQQVDLNEFTDVIHAYASHEFSKKLPLSENGTVMDAIANGINILGEELESTTISLDYFLNVYNAVSEFIIMIDTKGSIMKINSATEKALNKLGVEVIANPIESIIDIDFKKVKEALRSDQETDKSYQSFESTLKLGPSHTIPVNCSISKIFDLQLHNGYVIIAKNITEQKNREQKELKLIISAQENERKRLAADLHDSLGQEINAIKLYINSITYMNDSSQDYASSIETCKQIVDSSIDTIRNLSYNLMPQSLEKGNLFYAVSDLVNKLNHLINIQYNSPEFDLNLEKDTQILIYRIIQEFINNSLKHSKSTKIDIKITQDNNHFLIELSDNGIGFNFEKIKRGNGLYNIQTRLEALQANYEFGSSKKHGTQLKFAINEQNN